MIRKWFRRLWYGKPCQLCGGQPCQDVHIEAARDLPCPECHKPIPAYVFEFGGIGGPFSEGMAAARANKACDNPYPATDTFGTAGWLMGWLHAALDCKETVAHGPGTTRHPDTVTPNV
jgi:hypothetical protein